MTTRTDELPPVAPAPAEPTPAEADAEDAVAFLLREPHHPPAATRGGHVALEVAHVWGNVVVDVRQYGRGAELADRDVTIGAAVGHRWSFLGVDMGWAPGPVTAALQAAAPLWVDAAPTARADFRVPCALLPDEVDWKLVERRAADRGEDNTDGTGFTVRVPPGWTGFADVPDPAADSGVRRIGLGELAAAGRASASEDGVYVIPVTPDARLVLEGAGAVFVARLVRSDARAPTRPRDAIDLGFGAALALGGVVFATVALLTALAPTAHHGTALDVTPRIAEILLAAPPAPKPVAAREAGAEGAKAKKAEGKAGKRDAPRERTKGPDRTIRRRELDRQVAENAGVFGATADADVERMLGSSGLSAELSRGVGGLIGANGTPYGEGGLGSRGAGIGNGGTAEGIGGLGTRGIGSGDGHYGTGTGGVKADGAIDPVGEPVILGALDRSLIDEVIKRHMAEIRFCYQRELQRNPELGGKVVVKFTIARDGSVSQAAIRTSTMGNAAVEGCMAGRFMRMAFPKPNGGGIVIVSYPFLFSAG